MAPNFKLFVVDTGPLITLAAADSLDYLLFIDAGLVIPDAVLYEATHDAMKLGAQDILDWVKAKRTYVELAPTRAFVIFEAAHQSLPHLREPGLGERAAVEVIEEPDRLNGDERAVLLCEETAILKRVQVRDRNKIIELSTMDFLRLLEKRKRIQSSDATFELAERAGRRASRVEKMPQYCRHALRHRRPCPVDLGVAPSRPHMRAGPIGTHPSPCHHPPPTAR